MKRCGSSIVATPIMIAISIVFLTVFFMFIINLIIPFMIYLKIDNIATKYIYVIEKFGYLTENEKNNLYSDLDKQGINSNYVTLEIPSSKEPYGNLITLSINYEYTYNYFNILSATEKRKTNISVTKNSFSKIY